MAEICKCTVTTSHLVVSSYDCVKVKCCYFGLAVCIVWVYLNKGYCHLYSAFKNILNTITIHLDVREVRFDLIKSWYHYQLKMTGVNTHTHMNMHMHTTN